MKSFVLQFEEKRIQATPSGTEHRMSSGSEAADSDHGVPSIIAGTKTLTEVKSEGTDADPRSASFLALP
jgi:hypothetical protein